eukprot:Skav210631  [mRNA]  locus=scaffold1063:56393:61862:+ [translate_table: standard]
MTNRIRMLCRLDETLRIEKRPPSLIFHVDASLPFLVGLAAGHHCLMAMRRVADRTNERGQGSCDLPQHILAQFADIELSGRVRRVALIISHRVRCHPSCKLGILDDPIHRRGGLQWHVVTCGDFHWSHIVRLKFLRHELLELPVPVSEHVRPTSFEDFLFSVVLRHCSIALVNSDESIRPEADDAGCQVNEALELNSGTVPLMESRWKKHRLPTVHCQAHEALGDRNDGLRTMDDGTLCEPDILMVNRDVG